MCHAQKNYVTPYPKESSTLKFNLLTFSVLWTTYVTTSCLSTECYGRYMSPYLMLSLCAIGDICHHSFISEFCWTIKNSCEDFYKAFHDVTQREWGFECCYFQYVHQTFCGVWTMFFPQKLTILQAILVQIQSSILSEMELYNIWSTLVWTLDSDHEISADETVIPIVHICHTQKNLEVSKATPKSN